MSEPQAAIVGSRVAERIFAGQQPGGYCLDPITPCQPKYKAAYLRLILRGHLGLTREDEQV